MNGDRHTERNGRHSLRLQVSYASWGTKLPKAKDHRPSIADWEQVQGPCGAARNGHSCPDRVVCHEDRRSKRRCVTVREMKEGPSRPAVRFWPQTAASCCRQKRWW